VASLKIIVLCRDSNMVLLYERELNLKTHFITIKKQIKNYFITSFYIKKKK